MLSIKSATSSPWAIIGSLASQFFELMLRVRLHLEFLMLLTRASKNVYRQHMTIADMSGRTRDIVLSTAIALGAMFLPASDRRRFWLKETCVDLFGEQREHVVSH